MRDLSVKRSSTAGPRDSCSMPWASVLMNSAATNPCTTRENSQQYPQSTLNREWSPNRSSSVLTAYSLSIKVLRKAPAGENLLCSVGGWKCGRGFRRIVTIVLAHQTPARRRNALSEGTTDAGTSTQGRAQRFGRE